MLRKEKKQDHIKCSIKTRGGEKREKKRTGEKKFKVINISIIALSTISIITLNVNGLNPPM